MRVAVISDTHDLLRPEVLGFLRGCDHIVHAGDICTAPVLEALADIAPTTAVRGNNDRGEWASRLRPIERLQLGGISICVVHDLHDLGFDPAAAGVQVVVSGHSHKPSIERRGPVLWLNPGSAGPRRFSLPISAAELVIDGASVAARRIDFNN